MMASAETTMKRKIGHLLRRPGSLSSQDPIIRYHDFSYQEGNHISVSSEASVEWTSLASYFCPG